MMSKSSQTGKSMMMKSNSKQLDTSCSSKSRILYWWSVLFVLGLFLMQFNVCSARYLPTRADDSRKELIKQLLKELMDLPQQYEPMEQQRFVNKAGLAGLYPQSESGGSYLSKRSLSQSARVFKPAALPNNVNDQLQQLNNEQMI